MEIHRYEPTDKTSWDKFVQGSKNGTFLFLRDYMDYHSDRFDDHSLMVRDQKGKLLALDTVPNLRAAHGFEFKVTYSTNGENETKTLYGVDDRELVERVQALGVRQYSVNRTNLEDVYLAFTDGEEGLDSNVDDD